MCTSNQQAKRDLWMSRIMACRQSGLPDVRWCKENGVTPSSLYYWINKFRDEAIVIPDSNSESAIPYEQDIVPLHIIADCLKQELLKKDLLHADETTIQVLHEPGKKATTESYMWLFRSGADDEKPIVLFNYYASRGGYHAAEYLDGFEGYLHTDGYQGYEKVKGVTRCGCWSHLRRYFVEAIPPTPSKNGELSLGEIG